MAGLASLYERLPEPILRAVDHLMCRFDIHGWTCRGRLDHLPFQGKWL